MSSLWTQYINDTASICVLTYFLEKVEDEEIRPIIKEGVVRARKHIKLAKDIFTKMDFPIPIGFGNNDVNIGAPRLFSDSFMLMYIRHMSILGIGAGSVGLGLVTRPDIVVFQKQLIKDSIFLQDTTRELMLAQGTYVRPPFISTPDRVDFVEKQSFLTGFIGTQRPLTTIEITHLFMNIQTNSIGKALILGFAQCAKSEEITEYFLRGKKIAQKHMDLFSDILKKQDIPDPMSWDTSVTDSTTSPFSDKLMLFHIAAMIAAGIGNYGAAMAASPRKDIGLKYGSLIPEIALYAEDGANLMINRGWLEEPPQNDNREKLAKGT